MWCKLSPSNVSFTIGDILKPQTLPIGNLDLIITQRCIQNLPWYDLQKEAIYNLLSKLSDSGMLLLMECSKDGVIKLNKWRKILGYNEITNVEPWHNKFLENIRITNDFNVKIDHFSSTYMAFTRLFPRVLRAITKYSYLLPVLGNFGYDKLYKIKKNGK